MIDPENPKRRLTVVQILPALESGGVERGTLELARYLVEQGHRSIVISAGGRMVQQLQREGSEHLCLNLGRKHPAGLRHILPLRRWLRQVQPDIMHLRSRLPAWLAYLAWRGMDVRERPRLVTTVHGPYTPGYYSSVMVRGERVIVVSAMIREYVRTHWPWVDPRRIELIHRGVDRLYYAHGYQPDPDWLEAWYAEFPQTRDRLLLCLPARLTRWKGHEHFLEMIAVLKAHGLPVHGLMVGEAHAGKEVFRAALQDMVRDKDLSADVSFTGYRADLREIMSISQIVFSLSLEPEAFGRTTLEALSLGRPVLAYDHGGVGEQMRLILPRGALPVGDLGALVARAQEWLQSPPEVPSEHPFGLRDMLEKTVATYQTLMASE